MLGLNIGADPLRRLAIERTIDSGEAMMSEPLIRHRHQVWDHNHATCHASHKHPT